MAVADGDVVTAATGLEVVEKEAEEGEDAVDRLVVIAGCAAVVMAALPPPVVVGAEGVPAVEGVAEAGVVAAVVLPPVRKSGKCGAAHS